MHTWILYSTKLFLSIIKITPNYHKMWGLQFQSRKESLNSDLSAISPILTQWTAMHLSLPIIEYKKDIQHNYADKKQGLGLGRPQKHDQGEAVDGIITPFFLVITGSSTEIKKYANTIKSFTYSLPLKKTKKYNKAEW